jgi:hypothetical protein
MSKDGRQLSDVSPLTSAAIDVKELIERLLDYHAHDISDELAADAAAALKRLSAERDAAMRALRHIASRNVVYLTNSGSDNPAIMEIAIAALRKMGAGR